MSLLKFSSSRVRADYVEGVHSGSWTRHSSYMSMRLPPITRRQMYGGAAVIPPRPRSKGGLPRRTMHWKHILILGECASQSGASINQISEHLLSHRTNEADEATASGHDAIPLSEGCVMHRAMRMYRGSHGNL